MRIFDSTVGSARAFVGYGARAGIGESEIRVEAPHLQFFADGARAGTRTRVQALATLGDNHYTTLASATLRLDRGINGCRWK